MTPAETLAYLRTLTDPTPEQLREASWLALLACGWKVRQHANAPWEYISPCGHITQMMPHPCASLDDAVRWIVPEGCAVQWEPHDDGGYAARVIQNGQVTGWARTKTKKPSLVLAVAGLAARLENEK